MSIKEAKSFVINSVINPLLELDPADQKHAQKEKVEKLINIAKAQLSWINSFDKVGDLYEYLKFSTRNDSTFELLKSLNLKSYEEILSIFKYKFDKSLSEISTFEDFKIDELYSTRKILSVVKNYDTRTGGIQLLEVNGNIESIAIKATLKGGKYPNEWIIQDNVLKYYMKSVSNSFKESYKENKAILHSYGIPIHVFVRSDDKASFTYKGIFELSRDYNESLKIIEKQGDLEKEIEVQARWFLLEKVNYSRTTSAAETRLQTEIENFELSIRNSLSDSKEVRQKRLAKASKKAPKRTIQTIVYERNPDVVAEVLERAQGYCEQCGHLAPFNRKKDGTPYLEVHHKVRLADNGDDTVENAIALCPNCHRQQHFG